MGRPEIAIRPWGRVPRGGAPRRVGPRGYCGVQEASALHWVGSPRIALPALPKWALGLRERCSLEEREG